MNDKVSYWIDLAEYDIDTAKAMFDTKRYLYVGFMCHQTIEKALKAIIAGQGEEHPPRIHNLSKLAQKGMLYDDLSDSQKDFLDTLDPLNIATRYPDHKEKLAAMLTQNICIKIIVETEELLCWIKQRL